MATYLLTTGDDVVDGTAGADTFDGYAGDDGIGQTGGTDTLRGFGGNDRFLIDGYSGAVAGTIDGGADRDTVLTYGGLHELSFLNVEVLSVQRNFQNYELTASIAQLSAFSTITSAFASAPRIQFYLTGQGGTLDLSGRMASGQGVDLDAESLDSGYEVTGTAATTSSAIRATTTSFMPAPAMIISTPRILAGPTNCSGRRATMSST